MDSNAFTVMADKDPPSPNREDETLSFGRFRVKPAMTVRGAVFGMRIKDSLIITYLAPVHY